MSEPVAPTRDTHGFRLIQVEGPPYARGLQHGRQLAPEIKLLRQRLFTDIIYRQGRLMGTGFSAVLGGLLARMHPHIPRELREEMRGVADGAGVRYRDILLFNCFDDLIHGLMQIGPALAPILNHRFVAPVLGRLGCSSFVVPAERSHTAGPIHGRNLDYFLSDQFLDPNAIVPRTLRDHLVMLVVRPERGQPFVSVTWPGFVGVVTGMSAAHLSLACHTSTLAEERINGIALPLLYRVAMQYAHTIDEAEWILRGGRRTIGNNVTMACGASGEARRFELTMDDFATTRSRQDVLTCTNHFREDRLRTLQGDYAVPSSRHRLERLDELFADGRYHANHAHAALTDVCPRDAEQWQWDCLRNPGTIYSTVFEPADLVAWVRPHDVDERQFTRVELASLLRPNASATAA
ncbi:MAG: C45 family peptidase [Chloroflexota bacterium]